MMHKENRWEVFRPNSRPLLSHPLNVRSVGESALTPEWSKVPRKKWIVELFWGIEGRGEFRVGRQWIPVRAEEIFFYHPGELHEYRPRAGGWKFCWITFDHPDAGKWLQGFGLDRRRLSAGPCPSAHFRRISTALKEGTLYGERKAAHLAHGLLLEAELRIRPPAVEDLAARARQRIEENFTNSAWGVAELAAELAVHRSSIFRQFLASYGLTPSQYLQNCRIQKALSLLRKSQIQVQEVAWQSGFSDQNYFSRSVRQAVGMSPREFRAG